MFTQKCIFATFKFGICSQQMKEPGKLVGVDEIVAGLERLGESPEVTNPLRQYLRPALSTLPMYGLLNSFIHSVFDILSTFQEIPTRACRLW